MVEELTAPAAPSQSLAATHVYMMAAMCLAAGLAVGYLWRGSGAFAPSPKPFAAVASPSSSPHAAGVHTPSLEEMRQLADEQASPLLEKLKSDPNNSALLAQVGAIYHASHQFKEASAYYEKAVQIEPGNLGLRNKLASSLYRSGDVEAAIAQLNQALRHDPKDANSLFNLGMIRLQAKADGKGAVAAWQQLLKSNPQLSNDRKAEVQKLMANVLTTLSSQNGMEGARKP